MVLAELLVFEVFSRHHLLGLQLEGLWILMLSLILDVGIVVTAVSFLVELMPLWLNLVSL